MSTIKDLETADRMVKDAEIRFKTYKTQLENLEREVAHLTFADARLSRNIAYLKKRGIIASASEYRKIKTELEQIKAKLSVLKIDRDVCSEYYLNSEQELYHAKEHYARTLKSLGNNVIRGNFGKK